MKIETERETSGIETCMHTHLCIHMHTPGLEFNLVQLSGLNLKFN